MSETAIKERGEVNFPGGGGYVVRFRNSDLKRLEAQFDIGFFGTIIQAVVDNKGSFEMLDALIELSQTHQLVYHRSARCDLMQPLRGDGGLNLIRESS